MACRNRCASHHPSLSSVLCPLRTFTSCGLANNTFTASSKTLKTGFQYDPVLSITTCVTSSCFSQSRSRSSSAIIVPNRRVCFRASPCNGPVITQTAKNSFPTSMPAHRSTAAQIMSALLYADWRTVDVFLEYVLPRLNCSIRGCFTSTWPVSFSGQSARHYLLQPPSPVLQWIVLLPHFHLLGWPKPVIPFRLVIFLIWERVRRRFWHP